jgi:hypothetical protein
MFSAHNGHVGAVRLLLELGADPNAVRGCSLWGRALGQLLLPARVSTFLRSNPVSCQGVHSLQEPVVHHSG